MIQGRKVIFALAIASVLLAGCTSYGSTSPTGPTSAPGATRLYLSHDLMTSFYNLPITPLSPVVGSLSTPGFAFSMCVDGTGRLFETQTGAANDVLAFAQPIANMAAPAFTINVTLPSAGCVFDSAGNLYVSLPALTSKIAVIPAPVTSASVPNATFITTGLSFPGDVTVDATDDLFVCNQGSITEYAPLASGNTLLHTFGGVFSASGCAVGPDGNLYVANGTSDGEIDVYNAPFSNASAKALTISPPTAVNIWDIKFDSQKNMYVAGDSTTGSDVWVFAPPYTGATSALLLVSTVSGNEARGLALTN